MTIPTYDALMLPALRLCAQRVWSVRDIVDRIADDLRLSEAEKNLRQPSGETLISSRVSWALTYLKHAGLIDRPKRAHVYITEQGIEVLNQNPPRLTLAFLRQFPEFKAFLSRTRAQDDARATPNSVPDNATDASGPSTATPEEQIDTATRALDEALRDALLTRVLEQTPAFFERMIIDLLLAMGYGGSRADAGEQLGGTGDGGIDGVIREDQLGLDRVYLQAKRYAPGNTVGSETVQAFVGALMERGAQKGVLITTSGFSKAAQGVVTRLPNLRIVLIDGTELTRLLTRFNVGVRIGRAVEIKRLDLDYFEAADAE